MNRITVAYIAGSGRSGSTILSTLLAQMGGYAFVGEPVYLWEHGVVENRLCGCSRAFQECEFWQNILESMGEEDVAATAAEMVAGHYRYARTRHLLHVVTAGAQGRFGGQLAAYVARLEALYRAIHRGVGSRIIVDSSKYPSYALLLSRAPSIDLRVLHLVRDPRAVTYSWRRRKFHPGMGGEMHRMSRVKSSVLWTTWNAATELLLIRAVGPDNYLRVRYEDLVSDPAGSVCNIGAFLGRHHTAEDVLSILESVPRPSHSIGGNPVQFERKPLRIRNDDEWRRLMPLAERLLVTVLTLPLLVRYGYRVKL